MKYLSIFIVGIFILLCYPANCQDTTGYFTLYGHVVLPQGDFGDDIGSEAALAKTGYGGGIEFSIPSEFNFLHYLISAHIYVNGVDDTKLNSLIRKIYRGFNINVDAGNWINIPLMAGLQITSELNPTINFIGAGKIGINIIKGPTLHLTIEGVSSEVSYKTSTSFGFGFGGGIMVNNRFCVCLTYIGMSEPEINGEVTNLGESEKLDPFSQSISLLLISLGIKL